MLRSHSRHLPFPQQILAAGMMLLVAGSGTFTVSGQNSSPPVPPLAPLPGEYGSTAFDVYPAYDSGQTIAEQLRNAPAKLYQFDRALLSDVLRFLADDAGIPFVALPEAVGTQPRLVTFTMKASPFRVMETLASANGVAILYENGVWFMRPLNDREMIGRTYRLKFTPQERVRYKGGGQSGATTTQTAGSSGSAIPDLNINIQGATDVFEVEIPTLIEELKSLVGIPTSGSSGKIESEASVGNFPKLPTSTSDGASTGEGGGESTAQVIYNSDANTIFVVATRQQHHWVEGFLAAVDRPQALVGIEVKFFETTRDPSKELGINWAQTFGNGGFEVGFAQSAEITGNIGGNVSNADTTRNSNSTIRDSRTGVPPANDVQGLFDFTDRVDDALGLYDSLQNYNAGLGAGYTAVLQPDEVRFAIQAFMEDRETSIVQYPRVLTINNREVVIRSVTNEPVLASTSTVTPGIGGTTTAAVSYLPIGTIINILPKTMPDNSVILNVAITVSNLAGEVPIQGNLYPRARSRVYNAALQVDSGYTLAVGGLEEASDADVRNGIPVLKDIPVMGELFKSKGRSQRKRNLIIFITPTVINNRAATTGIGVTPQTVLPIRPNNPRPPAFTPDGTLVGGAGSLPDAIAWLNFQIRLYRQLNEENNVDEDTLKRIRGIINTAEMIRNQIAGFLVTQPARSAEFGTSAQQVDDAILELNNLLTRTRKNLIYPQ